MYSHTFAPIKVKFGAGESTPRAKFHVYRGNVSPLRGEKSIFGSKNNTGMAALRAGLPVNITQPVAHCRRILVEPFNTHIKIAEQRTIIQQHRLVHWPLMGGLLHSSKSARGGVMTSYTV